MDAQATASCCALPTGGFLRFFSALPDPRAANCIHKLSDIFAIAICAVICGAEGWVDVELFAMSKQAWLSTFLDLSHGIPSHDTFGRVFARIDPDAFERCFMNWMRSLKSAGVKLIAIDGKSIRRSFEHAWDKSGMVHLVSAFVEQNRMVFGQIAVRDKSNEIEAIPRLLELLDLTDSVVTIDAIGCQKEIAKQIVTEKQADYVLAVKENQPLLHEKVKRLLDEAILEKFAGLNHDFVETVDGDHGRIETRRVWMTDQVQHLPELLLQEWCALSSIAVVESVRETNGKTSIERRYFISSVSTMDAKTMAGYVRGHWSVENNLHWQLDVSFGEDDRRIRKDHGAENFSRLCRMALNLVKSDKSVKAGMKAKRKKAGWDEPYMLKLLTG
jgi:predicted transposase YbfD/YdcC